MNPSTTLAVAVGALALLLVLLIVLWVRSLGGRRRRRQQHDLGVLHAAVAKLDAPVDVGDQDDDPAVSDDGTVTREELQAAIDRLSQPRRGIINRSVHSPVTAYSKTTGLGRRHGERAAQWLAHRDVPPAGRVRQTPPS